MLDFLPEVFTKDDVIKLRDKMNSDMSPTSVANNLYNWKKRHHKQDPIVLTII